MNRRAFLLGAPGLAAPARVPVHGVFEFSMRGAAARAEVTGPSGKHIVPAFIDSGGGWKFRFSPRREGDYRFRIPATGQTGAFRCAGVAGDTALDKHGAPRVAPDRRHFAHADGTPWFWLADTAWNGALLSTKDEWEEYLKTRAAQRFTAVQFVMTQWRAGRADENGRKAFTVEDGRLALNFDFFRRMDERVAAVRRHGLVPVPVMLWALTSQDKESPGETLGTGLAIELAQYIQARYAAYGCLWFLGGDGDYRGEKAARWKEIGRAVFRPEFDRGPVSLHPRGMQDPWPGLKDEPWLDFFAYQSGHGDNAAKWRWQVEQGLAAGWRIDPPHPVLDAEPDYEGHIAYHSRQVINDDVVRRAVYSSLFAAPPAGTSYGAHGVWFWARKEEVPLDHASTGVAKPWRECLSYPGARQMKILRDLFDRVPWWSLRPVTPSPVQMLRTEDGRAALAYLPSNEPVRLDLASFLSRVEAVWMDPRDGTLRSAGPVRAAASVEFTPPGPGDWVLLLRN